MTKQRRRCACRAWLDGDPEDEQQLGDELRTHYAADVHQEWRTRQDLQAELAPALNVFVIPRERREHLPPVPRYSALQRARAQGGLGPTPLLVRQR